VLGGVASATLEGNRGRIVPTASSYSLGRMGAALSQMDFEVRFDVDFEDLGTQGVGFYVRQNGGWLQGTATHGRGYAVFVEGFRGARFAMWTEIDGTETEIPGSAATLTLTSNTLYSVRFRVTQASAGSTRLLGKVWDASQAEPSSFQIDIMDSTAQLQNLSGGVAVDSWSTATSGPISVGTQVDNIEVR